MKEDSVEAFAAELKELYNLTGPTYRDLAKQFGMSHTTIANWLRGKSFVRLEVMQEIVRLAGHDVEAWTERWRDLLMKSGKKRPVKASGRVSLTDNLTQLVRRTIGDLPGGTVIKINVEIHLP